MPARDVIQAVSRIVAYAMFANVFLLGLEFFTAFYSAFRAISIPSSISTRESNGHAELCADHVDVDDLRGHLARHALGACYRRKEGLLSLACIMLFISLWIDKGFGLIIGGFVPNPFEEINPYWPTDARGPDQRLASGPSASGAHVPVQDRHHGPRADCGRRDRTLKDISTGVDQRAHPNRMSPFFLSCEKIKFFFQMERNYYREDSKIAKKVQSVHEKHENLSKPHALEVNGSDPAKAHPDLRWALFLAGNASAPVSLMMYICTSQKVAMPRTNEAETDLPDHRQERLWKLKHQGQVL